ncbi:oligoendopeptidase F [Capsulimonas corticalis]|uniref:Oligopeptidase F n=1 Tax=Capsulimonas corticalis TaxID=2219043 RepID=A0A402D2W2_9BACT|nr:oligoendopeptidase F [Capsulimonas corticalis]BDI28382.1 oligoendopeptidase F [Capsulimonas corticalis]
MSQTLPRRQDVPLERQWAVESVFASREEWEAAFAAVDAKIPGLARFEGRIGESGALLLQATEEIEAVSQALEPVWLYAGMLAAGDAGDQEAQALTSRARELHTRFSTAVAFYDPDFLAISAEALATFQADEPKLDLYRHRFDTLALTKPHVRSSEVEGVLAQVGEISAGPHAAHSALIDADLKFADAVTPSGERLTVAQGSVASLVQHADRAVRKAAWESYADGYLGMKNTLAACLTTSGKSQIFKVRTRGYENVLHSRILTDAIPRVVVDNLLAAVKENLPVWHRYWNVLRKGLGVEKLHGYDVPLYESPATLTKNRSPLPFAQAVEIICDGMARLGERYLGPMRRGLLEDRWVDAWPNVGKGSGAFSSGTYGTRPFIMMNYDDDFLSLSTLAHELGHSMHSYLSWEKQPYVYADYSLFAAETASNFNQAMVRAHLLKTVTDRNIRLQVLEEAISNFHRYLFVMPTLAAFELDFYTRLETRQPVTADSMSAKIVALFREGYGDAVELDEPRLGITWAQFGHLYSAYYVYQYATGISAANALAQQVLAEGQPAADRYLAFLEAGGSLYPLDALKLAGIDMTSPAPITAAFGVLSGMIDEMEALVG